MPTNPQSQKNVPFYAGALGFNGIVWSLLLLCVVLVVLMSNNYEFLTPLMWLFAVGAGGIVVNGVLLVRKVVAGQFRQAILYGLGLLLLTVFLLWVRSNLHFGKVSG